MAIAVVLTGLTTQLPILGATRLLEGASTAASVPSILGFIALATAGNELLRGKAAARFEGATLAGIGVGFIVAPKLFEAIGPTAFFLNAADLRRLVPDLPGRREGSGRRARGRRRQHVGFRRYLELVRSAHVLLLAPTWIAVNASIGLWFSQSLFQFSKAEPEVPRPDVACAGTTPTRSRSPRSSSRSSSAPGLLYWGNRFKTMRRTTIILYGILGGAVLVGAGLGANHSGGLPVVVPIGAGLLAGGGLFVLAGATPAALGLLADISERFPADRGAIMGLYSVFLAIGQIIGSLIGGVRGRLARDRRHAPGDPVPCSRSP